MAGSDTYRESGSGAIVRLIIIGGGFLGQLLHTVFPRARVFDWRSKPPAVATRTIGPMYLWAPIPGLKNREYDVYTTIDGEPATDERVMAYKKKVGKEQDGSDWRAQFQYRMKGYDVELPNRVEYGKRIESVDRYSRRLNLHGGWEERYDSIISTIPLPALMTMCGIGAPSTFDSRPIYVKTYQHSISIDHPMYVNYLSDPNNPSYRETTREGKVYVESLVGGPDCARLVPGKIYANPSVNDVQKQLAVSNIWCLGRYATWSPDELAHETYGHAMKLAETLCP